MWVLNLSDNDNAVQAPNTTNISKRIEHEILVVFHVSCVNFNKEIIVAGGVIAFSDLIDRLHCIHKLLYKIVGMLLKSDIA